MLEDARVSPQDGRLSDLIVEPERAVELRHRAIEWPSWHLTKRQLCDLELLACGGFSPLRGFLGRRDYISVCESMRLADGTLWPIPITLDVPDDVLAAARRGQLCLRDPEGAPLAALRISEAWQPELAREAELVFGTTDVSHPGVANLLHRTNRHYVSGRLEVLQPPRHADFPDLRLTPAELRAEFARRGWHRVVSFQTRNPMHRAHQQLTLRAAHETSAKLLIHPVVGIGKPGDVDSHTRVRCYRAILEEYPDDTAMLAVLPLAMRMAGPREALWHALIRRNYGATHFVVGRDHAGPGENAAGNPFYHPYAGHELLRRYRDELGIDIVPFKRMVYLPDYEAYVPEDEAPQRAQVLSISGTELRNRLARGERLPSWFTPPSVAAELRRSYPSRAQQGFTVFLTGLSGTGKSTIAKVLSAKLRTQASRYVTVLDGDLVRRYLATEAGFSPAERDANVLRIGFVAAEITKHRGIAICAAIAPYDRARRDVCGMVQEGGGFLLVHVATPLEECERRDCKGLYAKARAGLLPQFTGISDPYEEPTDADVRVDSRTESADQAAERIIDKLRQLGYLVDTSSPPHETTGRTHDAAAVTRPVSLVPDVVGPALDGVRIRSASRSSTRPWVSTANGGIVGESLDIVLADGHTLFVDALMTVLVQNGHRVRFTASSLDGLVHGVSAFRPSVCVMDNQYPDGEGVDVIAGMSRASPETKIIILTADANAQTLRQALAAGAAGYVHKSRGVRVLLDAIARVAAGAVVVEGALVAPRPVETPGQHDLLRLAAYLTRRELECLALLAAGLDTTAMARQLGVSQTTVRSHVQSVLTKLGAHSRLEAASLATRFGLIGTPPGAPPATGTVGRPSRIPRAEGASWR